MGTHLKYQNFENRASSFLSWSKLGLEPKFHDPGTFGGFGKHEHTDRHTRFMFYKYRWGRDPKKATDNIIDRE